MELTDQKWAMLCYLPFFNVVTCPIAAVTKVNSSLCRFHARQGLIIFALWAGALVVGLFSAVISWMIWGIVLLLYVSGIVIAKHNSETRIPVIGQIALMIPEFYIFKLLTGKNPQELVDNKDTTKTN